MEAGLATLNACDLVDSTILDEHGIARRGLGVPRRGSYPIPGTVDECKTVDAALFGAVWVTLGGEFLASNRYNLERFELGGFTAYRGDITVLPEKEVACTVAFPISFSRAIQFIVKAMLPQDTYDTCRVAIDLASAALTQITDAAGERFLYRITEPDENVEGACVHYLNQGSHEGCVPYREAEVPDDAEEMLRQAHRNANVTCAAALSTVRGVVGDEVEAVTYGQSCVFLESTHTIRVSVFMSHSYVAAEYQFDDRYKKVTIAGHPAIAVDLPDSDGTYLVRDYTIATGDDANEMGVVGVEVQVSVSRGFSAFNAKADPAKLDSAEGIASRLMGRYF